MAVIAGDPPRACTIRAVSSGPLSDAACRLVREHIESMGRLDLLIVLYGDPRASWSAKRMGRQMRAPVRWAEAQMQSLQRAGILACTDTDDGPAWSYGPTDDGTAAAVQELITACQLDWAAVTREVMSLRPSGAEAFSDAFRLRRRDG